MDNLKIPAGEISSGIFESYLLQLSDKVKNCNKQIAILELAVKEKDTGNRYLESMLSERDRNISDLKAHIRSLEAVIAVNKSERDRDISDLEAHISNLEAVIEVNKKEIAGIKDELSMKNNEISIFNKMIELLHTVTGNKTGLMWKKYPERINESNSDSGSFEKFTWDNAMQRVRDINTGAGFAGYHDWRLPDTDELQSIVDKSFKRPCINPDVFPDTPSASFWSSSLYAADGALAWRVNFHNGFAVMDTKATICYVRLVRSGQ